MIEFLSYAPTREARKRNFYRYSTERELIETVVEEIETGDVFYDIGANTGIYAVTAALHNPGCYVEAFEPYAPNAEALRKNLSHFDISNVHVSEQAIADSPGEVSLSVPDSPEIGHGTASIGKESGKAVTVRAESCDSLVGSGVAPAPDVIKIDVEGAESLVLDGLDTVFAETECRAVYCEVHVGGDDPPPVAEYGSSLDGIMSELEAAGFTTRQLFERGSECFVEATR